MSPFGGPPAFFSFRGFFRLVFDPPVHFPKKFCCQLGFFLFVLILPLLPNCDSRAIGCSLVRPGCPGLMQCPPPPAGAGPPAFSSRMVPWWFSSGLPQPPVWLDGRRLPPSHEEVPSLAGTTLIPIFQFGCSSLVGDSRFFFALAPPDIAGSSIFGPGLFPPGQVIKLSPTVVFYDFPFFFAPRFWNAR